MRLGGIVLCLLFLSSFSLVYASYVPYQQEWSIYELDLETNETRIIYSNPDEIITIAVNPDESKLAYCLNHGEGYDYTELYTMDINGSGGTRLTNNTNWDLYPNWSPDSSEIAFLSWRNTSLDIWRMNANGSNQRLIYDSGDHDSDINWRGDHIAFTRDSQIWIMNSDGSDPRQLTDPPRATEWGNSVLPFGDYDPRISPDGTTVVFERLVNDSTTHGMYDFFLVDIYGSNERRLTETGWTQGIASWSPYGDNLIYLVSAMGYEGKYNIFRINVDGSDMVDLTSELYPSNFLCHSPKYSTDGSSIYFVGQWFRWERKGSTISCTVSQSEVNFGEYVVISGSVQPLVHDIEVIYKVQKPDGVNGIGYINSTDGSYSYLLDGHVAGEWTIEVEWTGDKGYEASSNSVSFVVKEQVEEQTGRIPGFPMVSVVIGLSILIYWRYYLQ